MPQSKFLFFWSLSRNKYQKVSSPLKHSEMAFFIQQKMNPHRQKICQDQYFHLFLHYICTCNRNLYNNVTETTAVRVVRQLKIKDITTTVVKYHFAVNTIKCSISNSPGGQDRMTSTRTHKESKINQKRETPTDRHTDR